MFRLLLALLLTAALLPACGGDGDENVASDTESPSGTASAVRTSSPGTTGTAAPSPTVPPEGLVYTVVAGDTLSGIADRYGVAVEAIIAANGITDPASLQIGQELTIPGSSGPPVTPPPPTAGPGGATPPPGPTAPPAQGVTLLTLVDKNHALPSDYVPPGLTTVSASYLAPGYSASLRSEVAGALGQMLDASGMDIRVTSGYRSYSQQVTTFNYWVSVLGYAEASRVSAQAGHSEHQLGATVDLSTAEVGWDLVESFGGTGAGQWLAANAHLYGFVLSYPNGAESVTGYAYEPWHFRYIGVAEAAAWKASGLTLNQYLGA